MGQLLIFRCLIVAVTLSRQFLIICIVLELILFYEISNNLIFEQKEVNGPTFDPKH